VYVKIQRPLLPKMQEGAKLETQKAEKLIQKVAELELVVKALGDASDKVSKKFNIVQPYLAIWLKHGELIEECREK